MSQRVEYRRDGSVAIITMNDGKANVLSSEMFAELTAAFDRAEAEGAVVLLTGREGVFSGGFDVRVLGAGGEPARAMVVTGFELAARLHAFPAPVVVACSGHSLAMGAFMMLAADFRIGAAGPFKIGVNEVAIGITMPHFGIEICRQRLAPAHFQRAVLNSEIFGPEDALVAGFLDQVVPQPELLETAMRKATELAKLDAKVHTASKLRVREQVLVRMRAAIAADGADFAARL